MTNKTVWIITIITLATGPQIGLASQKAHSPPLRVYLPRQVVINHNTIRLGAVGVIRGDRSLTDDAANVGLGRITAPGQRIIIDRPTILSRLASSGITASNVLLTGAETVEVKRREKVINGQRIVEVAQNFLKENPPHPLQCRWKPTGTPENVIIPGAADDIKLLPRFVGSPSAGQPKVAVHVLRRGKEMTVRQLRFNPEYKCQRAVALVDIPKGAVIFPEKIRIETATTNYLSRRSFTPPYGLVTKRPLRANSIIRPDMLRPPMPPMLVKRNKTVIIQIETPTLLVRATGQALQDGRTGEYIKVRNIDSRRIVTAKINEDGTLQPVF